MTKEEKEMACKLIILLDALLEETNKDYLKEEIKRQIAYLEKRI